MATAMRSEFMSGTSLQSTTAAPKPSTNKLQVSAIFKKAQKEAKKVQQSAKSKLPSSGTQAVKQGQKAVKKAAPAPPSSKKAQQAPKKAASKASNVFGGAKKQAKKATKQAGGSSKGWFGEERASGLDKWYGTYLKLHTRFASLAQAEPSSSRIVVGCRAISCPLPPPRSSGRRRDSRLPERPVGRRVSFLCLRIHPKHLSWSFGFLTMAFALQLRIRPSVSWQGSGNCREVQSIRAIACTMGYVGSSWYCHPGGPSSQWC